MNNSPVMVSLSTITSCLPLLSSLPITLKCHWLPWSEWRPISPRESLCMYTYCPSVVFELCRQSQLLWILVPQPCHVHKTLLTLWSIFLWLNPYILLSSFKWCELNLARGNVGILFNIEFSVLNFLSILTKHEFTITTSYHTEQFL